MEHKTIWKYEIDKLPLVDKCISMPKGADIVRVGAQGSFPCLWACVIPTESEAELENRLFFYSGTGMPVPMKARYIGSCTAGAFEWHVWER